MKGAIRRVHQPWQLSRTKPSPNAHRPRSFFPATGSYHIASRSSLLTNTHPSQGAQLVHLATRQLSPSVAQQIKAVVMFGDPDDGQAISDIPTGDVVTFCYATDLICDGAPIVLPAHLAYSLDAPAAANFAAGHVQV